MDITPKHPALEKRPSLKGYLALLCGKCGELVVVLKPGSASVAYCRAHPSAHRRIHALDEPCAVCIEISDRLIREGKGVS